MMPLYWLWVKAIQEFAQFLLGGLANWLCMPAISLLGFLVYIVLVELIAFWIFLSGSLFWPLAVFIIMGIGLNFVEMISFPLLLLGIVSVIVFYIVNWWMERKEDKKQGIKKNG